MKRIFALFLAFVAVGASMVSAQKTIVTVEKLWSITEPGGGAARQGFGMDGALYYHQNGKGVYKVAGATATPELIVDAAVSGIGAHAVAKDDAGNIVIFGSASFPTSNSSENFIYIQKKGETTGTKINSPVLEGFNRTDFIAASGDVFSADGGHLYLINNNGNAAFDIIITNGETAIAKSLVGVTALAGNQNAIMCTHEDGFHYASAGYGIYSYDGANTTSIYGLRGLNTQCLGATHFTLAGKELWAYHVGYNYTSQFKLLNKTDDIFVLDKNGNEEFAINNPTTASAGALRGVWLNTEKIDDNNYMLYAWHSHDGGAVYKVSAVTSALITLATNDDAMGIVEGAGEYAVGNKVTVKAISNLGHAFVCWKNGEEIVSTESEYTFEVTEDVALMAIFEAKEMQTLTLNVNDVELGTINILSGDIVLGDNSIVYGDEVTIEATSFDGATFIGWYIGDNLYSKKRIINFSITEDIVLTAKFVAIWTLSYELNGGVTNDYGWLSKAHMCLDLQEDYIFQGYWVDGHWALEQDDVVYYYVMGEWKLPEEVEGSAADVPGFLQASTYNTSDNFVKLLQKTKWLVLNNYINDLRIDAGNAVADEGAMRAELSGFFLNSPALTDYRQTNDYTIAGQPAIFGRRMKMGFDNPTEVTHKVVLNAPYKRGYTFRGWYATPDFSDEEITTLYPESKIEGGKLYAKWEKAVICDVYSADATKGSVKGDGEYDINATTIISAIPAFGYHFLRWNDGNTDNPREVILTEDVTYTAEFEANTYMLTAVANDEVMGSVIGGGEYLYMTQAKLVASANEHYRFVQWSDGVAANPRFIIVTQDTTFTAEFEVEVFNLWVASSEPNKGRVKVTLTAEPIEGFEFLEWSDGNQENPRVFYPTEDMQLFAYFQLKSSTPTDIESATISKAKVWGERGILHVEGANSDYCVLDTAGKLIYRGRQPMISLPVGVYVVTLAGEIEKVVL